MPSPQKSKAPPFVAGPITWEAWITSDGQRYVWRAAEDRLLAGKHSGSHEYWAKVDGEYLPNKFRDLKHAMFAAYRAMVMREMRRVS